MLKLKYLLAFIFIGMSLSLYSADLKFKTGNIKPGEIVDFTYSGNIKFNYSDRLKVFVYSFNSKNSLPVASEYELSLDRSNNQYVGSFAVPEGSVFCMMKISSGNKSDDNNGDYWQLLINDDNGKVVRNANLRAALSKMGNLPDNCRPAINYNMALNYLKEELKFYPDNFEAKIGLISLQYDLKTINKSEFEKQLKSVLSNNFDFASEGIVRAASRAYRILNQNSKAEEIEKDYARNNPKSNLSAELFLANLSKAQSFEKFAEGSSIFLRAYSDSPKYDNMIVLLAENYLEQDYVDDFIKVMKDFNRITPDVYSKLAFYYLDEKKNSDNALLWFGRALDAAKNPYIPQNDYMTATDRAFVNNLKLAEMNESLGILYEKINKDNESVAQLLNAKELYGKYPSASIYENIAKVYIKLKEYNKAIDILSDAVINNQSGQSALDLLGKTYKVAERGGDYILFLDSLNKLATVKRIEDLKEKNA